MITFILVVTIILIFGFFNEWYTERTRFGGFRIIGDEFFLTFLISSLMAVLISLIVTVIIASVPSYKGVEVESVNIVSNAAGEYYLEDDGRLTFFVKDEETKSISEKKVSGQSKYLEKVYHYDKDYSPKLEITETFLDDSSGILKYFMLFRSYGHTYTLHIPAKGEYF